MKGFPQQSGISPIKQNETASDIAGEAAGLSTAELGRAAEGMARGEEKSEIEPYESIEILNNPELNELKSKNEFKDIEIIPINIADEEIKNSKIFFEELGLNNLEIFYGPSIELAKKFKLRGIPTTIFIDKEGYEFARVIGYVDFENKSFLNWLSDNL